MADSKDVVVGVFVVIGFVILAIVTVFLRHWDPFNRQHTFYVRFEQVQKLDVGAPVQVAGIPVGTVAALQYIGPPRPVQVTLRIAKNVHLYSNARVRVSPSPVIGVTTVDIDAGGPIKKKAEGKEKIYELKPDSVLSGESPPELEATIAKVSDEIVQALEGVSAILNDPINQISIKQTMTNLASITDQVNNEFVPMISNLKKNSATINDVLKDLQKRIDQVSDDVMQSNKAFRSTTGDFGVTAKTLTGEIQTDSKQLQQTIGQFQRAFQANERHLTNVLKGLIQTAQDVSDLVKRIEKGQGSLGKFINDPRLFDQLQQILAGISQTLTGQRESSLPVAKPAGEQSPSVEPAHP